MKLVTYRSDGASRTAALVQGASGERLQDLNQLDPELPIDMLALLEGGEALLDRARRAVAGGTPEQGVDPATVRLQAPIPRPPKIICIGQNYLAHAQESNASASPHPIIFAKFANTVVGPGEPIVVPAAVEQPDYEGELGVVMGKVCRNVSEADALDYVAGYLALNDVSARDWQFRTSQWGIGKMPDTFCPMGPALVTKDEIADVHNLALRTVVSGEVLQEGHTSRMIFSIPRLIADMSRVITLEPGDVIATGTPAGVGFARVPPRWLRPGDVVRVEIEGVGVLENPVVAERDASS